MFPGFATKRHALETGDYSLEGHEARVSVERKSKEDAYGCVGASRRRFVECLQRLGNMHSGAIVIECGFDEFAVAPEYTRLHPAQAIGSFISWSQQYRIPIFWCPTREWAERTVVKWLASYLRHQK